MKFSIIVPVYNVAQYLPACIASLLEQTEQDFEILLIDDGSTDGLSGQLCDQYAKAHPEKIRVIHKDNGGQGTARNLGIDLAQGDYLFFVDSDDYIHLDALSILNAQIEKSHADAYQFGFYYVHHGVLSPGESTRLPLLTPLSPEEHPELLLESPSPCLRIVRRSIFLESGIRFTGKLWYEDLRTIPKLYCHIRTLIALPNRLYYYLLRDGSTMHNQSYHRNLEILDAVEDLRIYLAQQHVPSAWTESMCCLAVDSVLMAAQRVLMIDPKAQCLPEFLNYIHEVYPDYQKNPLLPCLGRKKRFVLHLLEGKHYRLANLLFRLKHLVRL